MAKKSADEKSELTPKQKEFCRQYLLLRNGTKAAEAAGYSKKTANEQASRLLANVNIKAAIEKGEQEIVKKFQIDQKKIIDSLADIAFFDPMSALEFDEKGRLVFKKNLDGLSGANFTVYPEYQNQNDKDEGIIRAKLSLMSGDRKGALELLGKHLGMWKGNDAGSGINQESRRAAIERIRNHLAKRNKKG